MGAVFLTDLAAVLLFFKELKICAFDPETASAQGMNVTAFHYLLMSLVSLTTVGAFDAVGRDSAWWRCWCCRALRRICSPTGWSDAGAGVGIGVVASVLGYLLARATDTPVAGAMAVAGGALFAWPSWSAGGNVRRGPVDGAA